MPHARQTIREAVATALTGLATTGSRVFQSRMRPQETLPCLLISTGDEAVDNTMGGVQQRVLEVVVTGIAKSATGTDDTLDTIATEVETAMQAAGTLGGVVDAPPSLTSTRITFDDSLEQPVGEVELAFQCFYFTNAGAPGTTL